MPPRVTRVTPPSSTLCPTTPSGRTQLVGFRPPESPRGRPRCPVRRAAPSFGTSSCDTEVPPPDRQSCGLTRLTSQRRLAPPVFGLLTSRLCPLGAGRGR